MSELALGSTLRLLRTGYCYLYDAIGVSGELRRLI